MPSIKPNESEADYVSRCVSYVIKNEGLTQKQAAGKCHGMYRNHKRGKSVAKHLGGSK